MRTGKKLAVIAVLLTGLILWTGCAHKKPGSSGGSNNSSSNINDVSDSTGTGKTEKQGPGGDSMSLPLGNREPGKKTDPKETDPIKVQIRGMTLKEKIGQMVMIGVEGYTPDDRAREMITEYHVGGIILFGRNVKSSVQLLNLINELKSIHAASGAKNSVPLFISVDEEGGRVSRMPSEFKRLPAGRAVGRINSAALSYQIGGILADELKSFGFNMNFAPVLDIDSNPENPVIGERAFGPDAKAVTELGTATMKGLRDGGVIPVVKHFPGHGDTLMDSHIGLPMVRHDMKRLKELELIPFEEAVKEGADAVMAAHILMREIDDTYPASLSRIVITDILREQMGFNGVVITDDMTMGAIVQNYDIGEAAVKTIEAGNDVVLVAHGYDQATAVLKALGEAAAEGIITEARIDESVYRVLKLKKKYKLDDRPRDSIDIARINAEIDRVLNSCFIK